MSKIKLCNDQYISEKHIPLFRDNKDPDVLFNYNASDLEMFHDVGHSLQYSATASNCFAKIYHTFMNNVDEPNEFMEKTSFDYDLSFIGQAHPMTFRGRFFKKFEENKARFKDKNLMIKINAQFFHLYNTEEMDKINLENRYKDVTKSSKFVLCPRGGCLTSIRFFEALKCGTIPIYIGDKKQKMPLDWLIDWDKASIRIDYEHVSSGGVWGIINNALDMSLEEINDRRKYIYRIYKQYLNNEETEIELVVKKIEQMKS